MPIARVTLSLLVCTALLAASPGAAAAAPSPLAELFTNPPMSARPLVWWHWMNGNVTRDGITKDLEWMKRAGLGGAQMYNEDLGTPQIVPERLRYREPGWNEAVRFAAAEADRLGLELAITSSPGWSETGGPWVKPADALKKIVWSETDVPGGRRFAGTLPAPPNVNGPFQAMKVHDELADMLGKPPAQPTAYTDVAVYAYPIAAGAPQPVVKRALAADGQAVSLAAGADREIVLAPGTAAAPATLTLDYGAPHTIRSATLFIEAGVSFFTGPAYAPTLEASDDGRGWHKIASIPVAGVPTTASFAPVTASQFRLVLTPVPIDVGNLDRGGAPGADAGPFETLAAGGPKPIRLMQFRLSDEARIDQFERKAGFALAFDYDGLSQGITDEPGIDRARIVDLTGRMRPDGALDWTPPPGRWRVVRIGAALTGALNHAAPPEATGLEVDKFDADAVRRYIDAYLDFYRAIVGPDLIGKRGISALLSDSIEVGAANWTPRLKEEFVRLRGYNADPYLLALTGVVVGSRAESDKFLYDYRRTLSDLMASAHYGTLAEAAHERGMKFYAEALEDGRPSLGDDMAMRAYADVPMAALWAFDRTAGPRPTFLADMKGAASVAHLLGRPAVAAESMTSLFSDWGFAPADMRRFIDLEFANGMNQPAIQGSAQQPTDDKQPGMTLGIFGQHFNRHETWAEMARPWIDYMARSGALLRWARDVADVAYFYGEEAPLTALYHDRPVADAPRANGYDFVNADALLNHLRVEDGTLVSTGGARYRVLYLGGSSRRMTLPVLRRLAALVQDGAIVVGQAPDSSPSLADDSAAFDALVRQLWSGRPTTRIGAGQVIATGDVAAALTTLGVRPDAEAGDNRLSFVHRTAPEADLYFVSNPTAAPVSTDVRFRIVGRAPELWRADDGTMEPLGFSVADGRTAVPMTLAPEESVFVVFEKPTTRTSGTVAKPALIPIATLGNKWSVAFQAGRGAPASLTLGRLGSFSEQTDPGVKYFSGIATYATTFELPGRSSPGAPLIVDLGAVGDIAAVRVNGVAIGTVWHAPYRLDIGNSVIAGSNRLEVRVANLWANRLIGDAQPGADKVAWTAVPTYRPDAPLRPAGLIGPVTLMVRASGSNAPAR